METIKIRLTAEQKQELQPLADKLVEYNDTTGMRGMLFAQVWITFSGEPLRMEIGFLDNPHGEQMIAIVNDYKEKMKEGKG